MTQFSNTDGVINLKLRNDELHILINLVEQLLELLGEGHFKHHYESDDPFAQMMMQQMMNIEEPISAPEDAVLQRLLPNAYSDPEAQSEFRRYTEPRLRHIKQGHLLHVRDALVKPVENEAESAEIEISEPQQWLIAINDLRLAMATRLQINPTSFEKYELMADTDPNKSLHAVYFWLGSLQDSLLGFLGNVYPASTPEVDSN